MPNHHRRNPSGQRTHRVLSLLALIPAALAGIAAISLPATGAPPSVAAAFKPPAADNVLRHLKPGHPRLMLNERALGDIRKSIAEDPLAARIHQNVIAGADKALAEKPPVHHLRDGRRLLFVSFEVLRRVSDLAYAFRMTGRKDYADRAWTELNAAANFKDWNPAHFLDTAVMTAALAIGYDWLWDQWTPEQRARLRESIVRLGLKPAMKVYQGRNGWHKVDYNWNQVCNGGIAMGALAVAEDEPGIASEIIARAVASVPLAMRAYAPDGAGREGAGYWAFGSQYNVLLLASLQSALGTDFGLSGVNGFRRSGFYQIYMAGTGRKAFDFSDSKVATLSTPQHFWMGRFYQIPMYSWFRYDTLRRGTPGGLWDLLWFDPAAAETRIEGLPTDRHFRGTEYASMRDSWEEGKGFVVALQGGSNRWTHRHYDLGSFILEADGVRWIIDSGREGQTYHRHVNHTPREDFYRVRAEGHNTLVINPDKGPGQASAAMAAFTKFESTPSTATAILDLSGAYKEDAGRVRRTFSLVRGKRFTVADEIAATKPAEVWSFFHTQAAVELAPDKRRATLSQDGKSLVAELLAPAGATFELLPAGPAAGSPKPAKQASNEGRHKLAVRLKDVTSTRVKVVFTLPTR